MALSSIRVPSRSAHSRKSTYKKLERRSVELIQGPVLKRTRHVCHAETILNPWQRYCMSLEQNPFITKAFTSLIGFMLGDMLAQKLEGSSVFDLGRILHLGLYGFILDGPVGHIWYKWLDGTCDKFFKDPKGTAAVATKTAADQLVWAPIMTCVFFAFTKLVEGHPELMLPTIQAKAVQTVAANYVIWPAAHIISFKYVPSQQRILYNNGIAIVWNAYLSIVAADAGLDASVLTAFDNQDAAALLGLQEVAMRVRSTLPTENYFWFGDLLQMAPPATMNHGLVSPGVISNPGITSYPFIESFSQIAIPTPPAS